MTDASTELVHTNAGDVASAIAGLNSGAGFYSSVSGTDFDSRMRVAEALTTSLPIDQNLGKTIALVDIIVQPVELTNETTGEVETAPRIVLLDADGTAYHATSVGLMSSVRNILAALGQPLTWPKPVTIQVIKEGQGTRQYFTVKFVRAAAK